MCPFFAAKFCLITLEKYLRNSGFCRSLVKTTWITIEKRPTGASEQQRLLVINERTGWAT
jgi:hypothetical protein